MFSQKQLTSTEKLITTRLGHDGYAFAQVRSRARSGQGYERSRRHVLRRPEEPRLRAPHQLRRHVETSTTRCSGERCVSSRARICRMCSSIVRKVLVQRLPYVKKVDYETKPVPGSPDLVDVDFKIEEGLPGQFGGSLGYSQTHGIIARRQLHPLELHGHGQTRCPESERRQVPEGLRRQLDGSVSQHRPAVADHPAHVSGHHAVHVGHVGLLYYRRCRPASRGHIRSRNCSPCVSALHIKTRSS